MLKQVCNENGNCHCNPGWKCPNCTEAYVGPGGSIDSGLSCQAPTVRPTTRNKAAEKSFPKISILLSIVFLCFLIFLCVGIYCYTRQRCVNPYNSEEAIYEEPVHEQENHVQAHENNVFGNVLFTLYKKYNIVSRVC